EEGERPEGDGGVGVESAWVSLVIELREGPGPVPARRSEGPTCEGHFVQDVGDVGGGSQRAPEWAHELPIVDAGLTLGDPERCTTQVDRAKLLSAAPRPENHDGEERHESEAAGGMGWRAHGEGYG